MNWRYPVALLLYWTTQQTYQFIQQSIMTRDMRKEGGWKTLIPWGKKDAKKPGKPAASRPPQPQVRPTPAVAGGPSLESIQARRDLDEKRRRRRNRKKKKRRR